MKKIIVLTLVVSMFNFVLYPYMDAKANSNVIPEELGNLDSTIIDDQNVIQENLDNSDDKLVTPYATNVMNIPGIGTVTFLVSGAILIGGLVYIAGSWLYDAVQSYLKAETADEYISKNRKAGIRKEFPGEYLNETLNEIEKDAKAGKAKARTAKKLLNDNRFKK